MPLLIIIPAVIGGAILTVFAILVVVMCRRSHRAASIDEGYPQNFGEVDPSHLCLYLKQSGSVLIVCKICNVDVSYGWPLRLNTELRKSLCTWLREYCRQVELEVVSNSRTRL